MSSEIKVHLTLKTRFWEITTNGKQCTKRWGATGSKGRSSVKKFKSKQECREHAEEAIEEKKDKGYREDAKQSSKKRKLSSESESESERPKKKRKVTKRKIKKESESESDSEPNSGVFQDHVFVYSGTFNGFKQSELKALITDNGGTVKTTVTMNVDCIIVDRINPDLNSTKCKEALNLDIPIVNIDYLTDSIKKKSVQKMKKYQIEEDAKLEKSYKKLTISGGTVPIDENFAKQNDHTGWRVFEENGTVYDATLNQTNIRNNNNKFYKIQILCNEKGEFNFYNRWGRIGERGQNSVKQQRKEECIQLFEKKFYAKTLNHWEDRKEFVTKAGKYTLLEMDYTEDDGKEGSEDEKTMDVESELAPEIQELIQLIFDKKMMERELKQIGYDAAKLPLGKLSESIIARAYEVLLSIEKALKKAEKKKAKKSRDDDDDNGSTSGRRRRSKRAKSGLDDESCGHDANVTDLSDRYYTLIPHVIGRSRSAIHDRIIDSRLKLNREMKLVEALAEVRVATELLRDGSGKKKVQRNVLDEHFDLLKCEMEVLPKKEKEFKMLEKYVHLTHAETHNRYTLEVEEVYKLDREGSSERFKPWSKDDNRMLLWHGSRLTNYVGIISQGLRIAPPEAPVTGYMFGKGVYFADMCSKSANYCFTSSESNTGLLLLCEVALGGMNKLTRADYHAAEGCKEKGMQSTKGCGSTSPDESTYITMDDGCVIPCGKGVKDTKMNTSLLYNEYIVYDTSQIKMKYLLKMKFNYEDDDDEW